MQSLKKDGIFIARMPCADSPFFGCAAYNDITHEWIATSGVIYHLLKMIGFKDVTILNDGPVPYKFVNLIRFCAFKLFCLFTSFACNFIGLGVPAIWTPNMWVVAKK